MTHTPGPWKVEGYEIIGDDERVRVCLIGTVTTANARLIAAAPIGLELAEAVLAAAADVFTPTKVLYLAHEFLAAAKGGKP